MLRCMLEQATKVDVGCVEELDLSPLVAATQGYVARDLCSLLQRAVHIHRMTHHKYKGDDSLVTVLTVK